MLNLIMTSRHTWTKVYICFILFYYVACSYYPKIYKKKMESMRIVRQNKIRDEEVFGSGILNRVIVSVSCLVDGGHSLYLISCLVVVDA